MVFLEAFGFGPGLEIIKHEFILRLRIKHNDWLLACGRVCKQPIIALYFESENELKFYNLEAWFLVLFLV